MTSDTPPTRPAADSGVRGSGSTPLWIAAVASLGAGAIHAAAIGAHAEHPAAARTFVALAAVQLAWGALRAGAVAEVDRAPRRAAERSGRDRLDHGEDVGHRLHRRPRRGRAGAVGGRPVAALAGLSVLGAVVHVAAAGVTLPTSPGHTAYSERGLQRASVAATVVLVALSVVGMGAVSGHTHPGGEAGHSHGADESAAHSHSGSGSGASQAIAPKPYDPTRPVDLSGVPGVTAEEQARAEQLVTSTVQKLPQFSDYTKLEALGYHSIQDGFTGFEHYVNWDYINDGRLLDPDHPESLVFATRQGPKHLVSAMFMAEQGTTLDNVPDIGGALTQWHIHDNLCYGATDPPEIAGVVPAGQDCPPGQRRLGDPRPMIHVWITKHACGPFAALEGVGAGQVKPGDTKACDHVHGSQ
ncbi:MAG: hypothetical protein U0Q22_19495 [Acidimicrobiales bacterium]